MRRIDKLEQAAREIIERRLGKFKIAAKSWSELGPALEGLSQGELVRAADAVVKDAILEGAAKVSVEALRDELHKLNVDGWDLRAEGVTRGGIAATRAHVDLAEQPQPHRRLPDVLAIIDASSLPESDRTRA